MSKIYEQRLNDARNRWAGEYSQFKMNWNELNDTQRADITRLRKDEIANLESNEQSRIAIQARLAQEKAVKDDERKTREAAARKQAETELKSKLRLTFLSANPSASDADFERLLPSMLDDHYKRETESRLTNQIESERHRYGTM